jgi:hypothetical protein
MPALDITAYGPTIAALLRDAPLTPLDVGQPQEKFRTTLAALTPEKLFAHTGKPLRDLKMAKCCIAGLWLRFDFFDESHAISQDIETPSGSYWHAILHRREPDYGNARYWFRRVGAHPIFPALNEAAMAAGWSKAPRWDAVAFVERIEQANRNKDESSEKLCREIQQIEWELLFDYCWRR